MLLLAVGDAASASSSSAAAMEPPGPALVIRIRIPDGGAVDWTVHPAPQLLFRDVLGYLEDMRQELLE
ncbi:UNVERIFIED_CONTAM: hypothetical protein K2H54_023261 [Gekko kuhli]